MRMLLKFKLLLRTFGRNGLVLLYAVRNPATPTWIKLATVAIILYAISPADFFSDLIPLLGWADDLALLALGIPWLLGKLPEAVRAQAEQRAAASNFSRFFNA